MISMLELKGTLKRDYSHSLLHRGRNRLVLLSWLPGIYFVISAKGTCIDEQIQNKYQSFPV